MEYKDRTIKCKDCGKDFVFSAGEQAFYAQKGFDRDPIRCQECRKAKKQRHNQSTQQSTMRPLKETGSYKITCKKCGKSIEVPFKPKFPDDILCTQCFETKK